MVYVKLVWFCLTQMSLIGLWQSGAELDGSDVLRQRVLRHRKLKDQATQALIALLVDDLTRAGIPLPQPR